MTRFPPRQMTMTRTPKLMFRLLSQRKMSKKRDRKKERMPAPLFKDSSDLPNQEEIIQKPNLNLVNSFLISFLYDKREHHNLGGFQSLILCTFHTALGDFIKYRRQNLCCAWDSKTKKSTDSLKSGVGCSIVYTFLKCFE